MSVGMVDFYPFAGYKLSADSKDHLRAAAHSSFNLLLH